MSEEQTIAGVPTPGQVIAGKYKVEAVLGAGGMGVVLAARHEVLGQRVAIKYLLPEVARAHKESAERFMREARASIELRSEHVARVLDVGTDADGAAFMVMEFLEGQDLQKASRAGPLAVSDVVEYVLQAAEALAEAHDHGIVHRDLKPANLFLASHRDGSPLVKVLDFGISKLSKGERGITRTDAVMGSPGYMSPEQIRSAKHVDRRADIWGLGVVMYELLAGKPPFDGDNVATLSAQIVLETPERVDQIRPEVPAALADVVVRCLAKEPAERFTDMKALADALVPFATPRAALLAERIRGSAGPVSVHAATVLASSTAGDSRTAQGTAGTIAGGRSAGGTVRLVLTAAAAAAAGGLLIWTLVRRSDPEVSADAALSANASASLRAADTAALPARPAEPTPAVVPALPTAAEPASSTAAAPASASAKPVSLPRRSPSAPACPTGQVRSKGHCCPVGLQWLNGRCDRPLATSLP